MNFETEFEGKSVVVTGACGIYGRWVVGGVRRRGRAICLTDRDAGRASDAAAGDRSAEGSFAMAADLKDARLDRGAARGGRRGAGGRPTSSSTMPASIRAASCSTSSVEDWDAIFDINLRASLRAVQGLCQADDRQGDAGLDRQHLLRRLAQDAEDGRCLLHLEDRARPADQGLRARARRIRHPRERAGARIYRGQHGQPAGARSCRAGAGGHPARPGDAGTTSARRLYLSSAAAGYVTGATLAVDGGNSIGSMDVYQDKKQAL